MHINEERKKLLREVLYKFELNGIINKFSHKIRRVIHPENYPENEIKNDTAKSETQQIVEKKETEEEKNKKQLDLLKLKKLEILINKKDRKNVIKLKEIFEKWNIKAKIMILSEYDKGKKKKKKKKKKKNNIKENKEEINEKGEE